MIATSQFTISVINDGQAYALQPSNSVIIMEEDGDYKPSQLSFQSVKLKGTDNPSSYSGRFKIERTSDETNWTTEYTSSSDESSITYNMPSTIEEKTPYIYRPTCNGDNVGSKAFDTIVGGTVNVNQLCQLQNGTFTSNGVTYTSNADGILTITGTATALSSVDLGYYPVITGHKVMLYSEDNGGWGTHILYCYNNSQIRGNSIGIITNETLRLRYQVWEGQTINATIKPQIHDLTAMFGATIADYIYSLETATAGAGVSWLKEHFPKIFNVGYIPYNPGELISVSGVSEKRNVGFNQWDEEWEVGGLRWADGELAPITDRIRSKNYCHCKPNTTYYAKSPNGSIYGFWYDSQKNFIGYNPSSSNNLLTTPANTEYFKLVNSNITTVDHDICINISDPARNGEYEPYEKHTYPLDSSITLRGIPKLDASNNLYYDGDEYSADGTVNRRYGVVDLGTLNWGIHNHATFGQYFYGDITSLGVKFSGSFVSLITNAVSSKYTNTVCSISSFLDKCMCFDGNTSARQVTQIQIKDSAYTDAASFKAAMSGVMLVYELATPTTETAEPYQQMQICDNSGTEEYVTTGIVPVGHITKYTQDISSIRCSLYASGGTTTLLDQQIIPVVNDAESAVYMTKQIEEYRLSDSSSSMTGSGDGYEWADTMPTVPPGKYLWKRLKSYFSNGSIAYSDAHCDVVTSGLVFDVGKNTEAIISKVWESDITTKINEYDGSTGKSIRDRVAKTETDISGINTTISDIQTDVAEKADGSTVTTLTTKVNTISDTVDGHTQTIQSNTSRIDDAEDEIESTKTIANQTADKFTWLVEDGTSASNFTLTSRVAELISPQVVIKDPAGSATIITGGKIQANAITTDMLDTNAIKSHNYQASPNASSPYSAVGTFLDLATGTLYMPQFGVDGVTGAAYFNGTVNANAGKFGDDTSYWNIETVIDYNAQPHAALVSTGSPYLQTGNWQVSDNSVATRKYTSTSDSAGKATYYKDAGTNTFYDVGMKIPTSFTKGEDNNADRYHRAFFYQRKYTGDTAPSVDGNWQYPFIVDNEGRVYCTDLIIIGGGSGTTYLPLAGGTITGDLTVNGKLNAKGAVTTTLMLQTNLDSTSAAQLTGSASATVKPGITGMLGVGNGGTGKSSWTANRLVYSSTTNALSELAAGTAGQILKSNGSSAPTWISQSEIVAGSATNDGEGNEIATSYRKLDDNQFDTINVTDLYAGDLVVTGAARFTNGIYGTASEASKVTNALTIQLNGGTTEGINKFTYDGSAVKNINITRSSIGLGAAADKAVDTSIAAGSSSANLPTSAAVAAFVEGKGYVTSSGVTSVRVQATSPVVSSQNTAQSSTLNTIISLADSYGDTKNPYGTKTANYVLAGPSSGNAAAPSFRKLVAADIPSLTKSKISDFPTTWSLTDITGADDLKAIEGLTGASGILKKTAANTWALSTVISGLSINNDVLTVTKSDGTTQDLTINITGQVVSGATVLSDASGNPISKGSASVPVYFSNGVPVSANTIPTIALNGGNTTSPSFYAPTGAGTSGQYLKSNGSGAPTWATFSKSTVGLGNVDNTADANKNVLTATKFAAAQSVTLTGDTTGTASSQAGWSITTKTDRLSTVGDNRTAATKPNDYANKIIFQGLKVNSSFGSPSTDQYSYVVGLRGWEDSSGGHSHELAFNNSGISRRSGATTSWGNWVKLIDSGNYTDYTVTKTGTGATGTWGIDISGNATNATNAKNWGFVATNELRFDINTKPSSATNALIGYKWSDGSTDAKINRYKFYNGGGADALAEVEASTFYGALSGNATSATKATQDSDGNAINTTYLKLSGGTMTGTITTPHGKEALHFPSTDGSYGTGVVYGINGNEALSVITKNAVTSFMVVHGSDPATWENGTWYSAAPTLQTKNKSVYVNELIAQNTTPTYNFKVNGTSYLGGEVRVSHNNADTESVSLKYNETMKSLDFIFN